MNLKNYHSKGLSLLMIGCLLMSSSLFYTAFADEFDVALSLTVSGAVQAYFADQTLTPVTNHSAILSAVDFDPSSEQTSTGELSGEDGGTFLAVYNPTNSGAWDLTIAATDGAEALWVSDDLEMDYNDAIGGTGQLSLIFDSASIVTCPTVTGPNTTNIALSTNTHSFVQGVDEDAITIAIADVTAEAPNCVAIDEIGLSQTVPPGTPASSTPFALSLTISAIP